MAKVVLWGAALCLWSGMVRHVNLGGTSLGFLTKPLQHLSEFPSLSLQALRAIGAPPPTYQPCPPDFQAVQALPYDLMALVGNFSARGSWQVDWVNLRHDSLLWRWPLEQAGPLLGADPRQRPLHSYLVGNKDLIVAFHRQHIGRIDSTGTLKWRYTHRRPHHALNPGPDGDIWFPATETDEEGVVVPRFSPGETAPIPFVDEWLVQLDEETGQELSAHALSDIFDRHHLGHLMDKSVDTSDPFHLNDIQPAHVDGAYFRRGDLFLSLRNLSLIVQYRPTTREIVRVIRGPFSFQHDVDILSDSTICIFDNHTMGPAWPPWLGTQLDWNLRLPENPMPDPARIRQVARYNRVLIYHLHDGRFDTLYAEQFDRHRIFTHTEGLATVLPTGDLFVEAQNTGIVWVFNQDSTYLKQVFPTSRPGYCHTLNWTRVWVPQAPDAPFPTRLQLTF